MKRKLKFGFSQVQTIAACAVFFALATSGKAQLTRNAVEEKLGYPRDARLLVIQAEDLGMAHSVDKASFEALEKGWVTTANVLVPGPWFPEVVRWSKDHPNADLGVALDLNSDWSSYRWRPLTHLENSSGLTDFAGYLSTSDYYVAEHATGGWPASGDLTFARTLGAPHLPVLEMWESKLLRAASALTYRPSNFSNSSTLILWWAATCFRMAGAQVRGDDG